MTSRPVESWILQLGRTLIDSERGALRGKRYLVIDCDTQYTDQFRRLVRKSGTEVIRLPPRSPNLNAHAERFVRAIKEACLNRIIFIGPASLRRAVSEFLKHYQAERNHQGLGNRLLRGRPAPVDDHGNVQCRERLGGMINFYYRQAAYALPVLFLDSTAWAVLKDWFDSTCTFRQLKAHLRAIFSYQMLRFD